MRKGRGWFITGFLIAPILLYVVYVLLPYGATALFSITDFDGLNPDWQIVGFENFGNLLEDEVFLRAIGHNVVVLTIFPIVTILIALFFAFMLNVGGRGDKAGVRGVFGSAIYKFIFFFPQVMSIAIVAVIWRRVLQSNEGGMLNAVLMKLGFVDRNDPELFLADPTPAFGTPQIHIGPMTLDIPVVLVCLIAIAVWGSVGFYLVLFSAAMQSIPKDIFEAATLDGATRVQSFFRVTLPLLRDHVSVAWVYLGIAALDFYALVIGLTPDPGGGGPNHASEVMSSVMMSNVLRPSRYDAFAYACATGISIAIITLLFAALQFRVTRSRDKIEF
jgi:N-acetylglucosamine transport system permease protein